MEANCCVAVVKAVGKKLDRERVEQKLDVRMRRQKRVCLAGSRGMGMMCGFEVVLIG